VDEPIGRCWKDSGRESLDASGKDAARSVCPPPGDSQPRSSGSRRQALGRRKSRSGLVSVGPASIGSMV
jgi:hypothetical protein